MTSSALKVFIQNTIIPACIANARRQIIVPSMEYKNRFNDPNFVEEYKREFVYYLQMNRTNSNFDFDYKCPKKFVEEIN